MLFKDREINLDRPKVMGILNVTPDSFSDGGQFSALQHALRHAREMTEQGATFIDVGGESTRPGAQKVGVEQELERVIPVIEKISKQIDVVISIDTSKPEVMQAAIAAGASMINDVRALSLPKALETAARLSQELNIPTCIMHMQGAPDIMQIAPTYDSVVDELIEFFRLQLERLTQAGFHYNKIILDPGFGFGKTLDHNYKLLKNLKQFTQFDLPVLAGMSRKSMIGNLLNKDVDNRLAGDIASATIAAMSGANIIRVHDVGPTIDALKIVDKMNTIK